MLQEVTTEQLLLLPLPSFLRMELHWAIQEAFFSAIPNFILSCNLPPTPQNDNFTTPEDTPLSGSVASNDSDLETINLAYQAGTFTTSQGGTIVINTNGTFTYTPLPNFNGTDTYLYTVCDNGQPTNQCATATITIQVFTCK